MHISNAGEATKNRLVFKKIMSLSAQKSAIATIGEWRDGLCCLKLPFASFDCAIHLHCTYLALLCSTIDTCEIFLLLITATGGWPCSHWYYICSCMCRWVSKEEATGHREKNSYCCKCNLATHTHTHYLSLNANL